MPKQLNSFDFAQGWASLTVPTEVRVRGLLMGTYHPNEVIEAQHRIPATKFARTFRHLRNPVIITAHGKLKGSWEPNPDFPLDQHPAKDLPLDGSDPYSEAMVTIRQVLEWAHEHGAAMSEGEYSILAEFAKVLAEEDPYLVSPVIRIILETAKKLDKEFQASIR